MGLLNEVSESVPK